LQTNSAQERRKIESNNEITVHAGANYISSTLMIRCHAVIFAERMLFPNAWNVCAFAMILL
jgi:hypothetical protein